MNLPFDRGTLAQILADKGMRDLQERVAKAIAGLRNAEPIASRLLECVFDVIPAERGAILLDLAPVVFRPAPFDMDLKSASSQLCVPGLIYVDSSKSGAFNTRHTHMLIAMAAEAATALEFGHYIDSLVEEKRQLSGYAYSDHGLIGESPVIVELRTFIDRVAPADSSVLILGEMGTGKELVANAIHLASPRASCPFMAINCAAIPENLIESELFGHERGAFSGADSLKKGKIEAAEGGTIFLDEIGELKKPLQAVLLRILQERTFQRVGGTQTLRANVRVLAATNRDLEAWVNQGEFRGDLYYRLNVIQCRTPSLRQIRGDIPLLADHFVEKFRYTRLMPVKGISEEALKLLVHFDWPGNIRQLQNAIERAMVIGRSEWIEPDDLAINPQPSKKQKALNRKTAIEQALRQADGRIARAALILHMSERHLRRLVGKLGIQPE